MRNSVFDNLFLLLLLFGTVSCVSEVQVELVEDLDHKFYAESLADGTGVSLESPTISVSDSLTVYSIKRSAKGDYLENSSVSWSSSGGIGTLTISPDGKSAQFNASSPGEGIVSIVVDGKVLNSFSIKVTIGTLNVSNLNLSSVTSDGFVASIDFNGGTSSAVHTLYYCNRTSVPSCDPVATGASVLMSRSGQTQTVTLGGLSSPTDIYAVEVVSTDSGDVNGLPLATTQTLDGTSISISNLTFSDSNKNGMNISVDYIGDSEANGTVNLYYCNETDSPGCNPLISPPTLMSRNAGNFTLNLSGLTTPNDEGDELNFSVVATDENGTSGSPLTGSEYLADLKLSDLSLDEVTSNSFKVSVNFSESNGNAGVNLYWCNETDSISCDPLSGTVIAMSRNGGKFEATILGLNAPNDHGDEISIQILGSDLEGVAHTTGMSDVFRLTDMEFSDLNLFAITETSFFVDTLISDDNLDTNSNLDIKAYWCNDTLNPGCDPLASGNVYSTVGGWRSYGFDIQDLVAAPGDEVSVSVEINDSDGIYITSSTNRSFSEVLVSSFVVPNSKDIFRSIGPGQNMAIAESGIIGGNLTVTGDTAVFDNNLMDFNGVGDVIFYEATGGGGLYNAMAFIHARTDNKTYTIKNISGGTPLAAIPTSNWKVYRAYTSLADALVGSENPGIALDPDVSAFSNFDTWVDGKDISAQTGSDESWNFALYAGVQADTEAAELKETWVKDRANKIKIFVVKDAIHVGRSQRHFGVWNESRYRLRVTDDTALLVQTNTTTIEGLQIETLGTADAVSGISSRNNSKGVISYNIIKNSNIGDSLNGINYYDYSQRGDTSLLAFNNIIYDFSTINSKGLNVSWQEQGTKSIRVYNNTFYGNYLGLFSRSWRSSQVVNNIFLGSVLADVSAEGTGGFSLFQYNILSDSSIDLHSTSGPKVGNRKNISSSGFFFNLEARSFYLVSPGSFEAIDNGEDLSSDFGDDASGFTRDAIFDIGALEWAPSA